MDIPRHAPHYDLSEIATLIAGGNDKDNPLSVDKLKGFKEKGVSADAVAVAGVDQINDLLAAGYSET